jgi:hypothetical protein
MLSGSVRLRANFGADHVPIEVYSCKAHDIEHGLGGFGEMGMARVSGTAAGVRPYKRRSWPDTPGFPEARLPYPDGLVAAGFCARRQTTPITNRPATRAGQKNDLPDRFSDS